MWTRLDRVEPGEPFGYWIIAAMIVDSISLIIDAIDVLRYLEGERQPYITAAN
ncbi:MAG: hypothetical protein O7I42_10675 [Alphaproteobacteria bacterium]|nr:hypothetical protein [Alphaproteobacteria bacterium]